MKIKLLEIFNWYGYHHQLKKLKEEQKEVREAIKWYELVKDNENSELIEAYKKEVASEIADNLVLLGQFMVAYDIPKELVKGIMLYKIDRTLNERGNERIGR